MSARAGMDRKLRVGLLLRGFSLAGWEAEIVERIAKSDFAEICLYVVDARNAQTAGRRRLPAIDRTALFRLCGRLERKLFARKLRFAADAHRDVSELLNGIPAIGITPAERGFTDIFSDRDTAAVVAHRPDLLLRFGFRIIAGAILTSCPAGIWSFHHGDNRVNRGGPSGFWEVMNGERTSGITLQILSDALDAGRVVRRDILKTEPILYTRNLDQLLAASPDMMLTELRRLHAFGLEAFLDRIDRNKPLEFYSLPLLKAPGNLRMAALAVRHSFRVAIRLGSKLGRRERWMVLYRFSPEPSNELFRFRRLTPPNDVFWADPFAHVEDGRTFVFFEEYVYAAGKGHIAVVELKQDGPVGPSRIALEQPHHLSYPFLYRAGDSLYMIPESAAAGEVVAYRLESFPDCWVRSHRLLGGVHASDPTLFWHAGRHWLFVSVRSVVGSDEQLLNLYFSDDFKSGAWVPHPMNPIVTDVRYAKPAGAVFRSGERIVRPAQDCSRRYGGSIRFMGIRELTPDRYEEAEVARATPDWAAGWEAMHTYNFVPGLTVIDAAADELRWTS